MPDGLEPDTQPLQTQPEPADAWVLGGRYRVLDRVGSGGMAEVFRAHDDLLNRDVAVKVFRTLVDDADSSTNGAARRELELHSLAQLNHPNLITLFDGSVAGDGPGYLVLEFVRGPDLASRLREGALPEPEVREIGSQIADALAYVHAHGMVHRDVKPANILLGTEEASGGSARLRSRLSDFGIVRMIDSPQVTSVDLTVGTAYYIAPEQARGSSVGPEADVYALGLVLIEALTGVRAFDGPMHEALAARLNSDPRIPDGLPEPWPALLAAMTAPDPAVRPDAAEVAQRLRADGGTATFAASGGALAPMAGLASATAATTALPAAPVAAMAAPAVAEAISRPVPAHRSRRRFLPAAVLGSVALAAAVALGTFFLTAHPSGGPAGGPATAPPTTHHGASATHRHRSSAAAVQVNTAPTTHHSSTAAKHTKPAKAKTSAGAPAPGTTTTAPGASSSAAPSSSSAPPSSSPATSAATSSPAAAAVAPVTSGP